MKVSMIYMSRKPENTPWKRIWKALWDQQTDHRIQRRAVVSSRAFKLAKGSEIVRKNGKDQLSADPHQPV